MTAPHREMAQELTLAELPLTIETTCSPDETREAAVDRLVAAGLDSAPVLDAERRPVGTVSVVQLLARRPGERVADRLTRLPVVGDREERARDVAERAVRAGAALIIVVDAAGIAVGAIPSVEVTARVAGLALDAAWRTEIDPRTGAAWSCLRALRAEALGAVPLAPGVLALIRGGREVHETLVWSEETPNLRARLVAMLSHPEQETPQLARLLVNCEDLRFRAAAIGDAALRRFALDQIRSGALRVARPSL